MQINNLGLGAGVGGGKQLIFVLVGADVVLAAPPRPSPHPSAAKVLLSLLTAVVELGKVRQEAPGPQKRMRF